MEFLGDLANNSFNSYNCNGFVVFKSIDDKIYLIYSNNNKSIISYDILNKKIFTEIKNAHNENITSYRHYSDNINKRDLVLSVSETDNNVKLWNSNVWECLLNIQNINQFGDLISACFLNFNKNIYIITSNLIHDKKPEPIKVFDLNGKKIKELNDSSTDFRDNTKFIDTYYNKKTSKVYILTCKETSLKIYDYKSNKIYNIIHSITGSNVVIDDDNDDIHMIVPCCDGFLRILDFDSGKLLIKIKINNDGLFEAFLWSSDFLFVGARDNSIKMIDLKKKKIIHTLKGHNNFVRTMKKINIPEFGDCLISQGLGIETIKLWKFK